MIGVDRHQIGAAARGNGPDRTTASHGAARQRCAIQRQADRAINRGEPRPAAIAQALGVFELAQFGRHADLDVAVGTDAIVPAGFGKGDAVKDAIAKATERILSDAMLESIDQKNQPSLQDIEAYARTSYNANQGKFGEPEQVRASHILIRTGEANAREKLQEIHKQIKAGADFAETAKVRSQDPGSASKGGDLGFFARGRMIKPFEDVVFAMTQKGQMSEVFESPFGFHIIQLTDRKPAGTKMFSEVKEQLMRESQSAIIMQGRVKEQERILKAARFDDEGIEAMAKSFSTTKP